MSARRWMTVPVALFALSCNADDPQADSVVRGNACSVAYAMDEIREAPIIRYLPMERYGSVDESAELAWGRVADVAVDSNGTAYVADAVRKQVFVLAAGGIVVETIGREGQGPGEFEYPIVVEIVHDSIFVFDPHLWRVTTIDREGSGVAVSSPPSDARIGQVWEGTFSSNGRLFHLGYEGYQASLMSDLSGRREGVVRGRTEIRSWDRLADEWRQVLEVPGPEVFADLDEGRIRDLPFAKKPLWTVDDANAVWYADNSTYSLLHVGSDGAVTCVGAVEVEPPSVSDDEVEEFRSASQVEDLDDRRRLATVRQSIPVPETKPVLEAIVAGHDGTVWVRPAPELVLREDGLVTWHAWSASEGLTHSVLVPEDVKPIAVSQDRIIGIETDELDVQYVVLLEPAPVA